MENIVQKLNDYAHGCEKKDFEGFDNIYNKVVKGKMILKLSDIVLLCEIFNESFKHIEPHQYCDIQEMTIITMNNYDLTSAFKELVNGLNLIFNNAPDHVEEYMMAIFDNYDDDELTIFAKAINDLALNYKSKFITLLDKLKIERQDYEDEIKVLLNNIVI